MGVFNLKTRSITLPEEITTDIERLHIFPTSKEDHYGVVNHRLGIEKKADGSYKASKQGELKQLNCKSADLEFAFYFENIPIIKLINKT